MERNEMIKEINIIFIDVLDAAAKDAEESI